MTEICPIHNCEYRTGRNMANAPEGRYCSWDGSMHPDEFMAYLDKPGTRLTPTDKNYKVYIEVASDEPEQMRVMCSTNREPTRSRPGDENGMEFGREWMTWDEALERWLQVGSRGSKRESKFYFEHLSEEQQQAFVDKLNAGELALEFPGRFYRLPFFISHG